MSGRLLGPRSSARRHGLRGPSHRPPSARGGTGPGTATPSFSHPRGFVSENAFRQAAGRLDGGVLPRGTVVVGDTRGLSGWQRHPVS